MEPKFIKRIHISTRFMGELDVNVFLTMYQDNNALALFGTIHNDDVTPFQAQEMLATFTTNLWANELAEDEVAIKNWSENVGFIEDLIKAEIISEPVRSIPTGHVLAPICKLLIEV